MDLLIGAVARIDGAMDLIEELNTDMRIEGDLVSRPLGAWAEELRVFLYNMGESGVFERLVLKVQRPITSNDPEALKTGFVLVYTEGHTMRAEVTVSPDIYAWFNEDYKMYAEARLWASGLLQLVRRVGEQPW